jgi:hypothetical protein
MAQGAASHSRVAVVSAGLRWHGLCGNVKYQQIQHTLNIAKVTAQAGSTSLA